MRRQLLAAVMSLSAAFALAPVANAGITPAPVAGADANMIQVQQRGTGVVEGGSRGGGGGGFSGRSMGAGPRMNAPRAQFRSGQVRRGNVFQQRYGLRPSLQQRRYVQRPGFQRRGGYGYYRGYRGYRDYRRGYRSYNGYWFPAAAFGALVGGAIASQAGAGNQHVAWCQNRWRSYRVSDNTYQPLSGPRRACVSPHS
ncbi:MAG: hypothetical protein JWL93_1359 [Hyphomicrobiales bacterium]|nr:hypothetical protein [Hyphomicrobiales bacterium]